MYFSFPIVLPLFVFIVGVYSKRLPLPPYFKSCHRSDPNIDQCAIQHGNEAIPTLVKGDRKYGIPVLSPLVLPSVVLSTDENFKINMRDIHINNLERAEVKDIKIDIKNRRAKVQLLFDKVTIVGKYEVNGRILILPIQGDGDINVTTDALKVHYTVDYTTEQKDGEDYIVPVNAQSDFTVKKASFHLSNLFNGNEQLGEATNKVLNDEWDKFVEAIKPAMNNLISEIATGIVKTITSKIPYNDFFPE